MKVTGLMQWAIKKLNINFVGNLKSLKNFIILSFNGYSGLLWPFESSTIGIFEKK